MRTPDSPAPPCPRCRFPLAPFPHQGVTPLVCGTCQGVLVRGTERLAQLGDAAGLLAVAEVPPDRAGRLACPFGCGGMEPRDVPLPGGRIELDACPACASAWFDGGELRALREAAKQARGSPRRDATSTAAPPRHRAQEALDHIAHTQRHAPVGGSPEGTAGGWLFSFLTQLPIEGFNPVHRFPLVVWALIAACVAAFFAEVGDPEAVLAGFALVPSRLGAVPDGPPRLVTSMFLHGGLTHLLGNMYFLKVFGDNVEDRLGRRWFLGFYLLTGIAASLAHVFSDPASTVPMVGASGAISGVLGAYLVFFPHARIFIAPNLLTFFRRFPIRAMYYLPFWLLWNLAAALLGVGMVAWWAHIGGFVVGAAFAAAARGRLADARLRVARGG